MLPNPVDEFLALASSEQEHVTGVTTCLEHLYFELISVVTFFPDISLLQIHFCWLIFGQISNGVEPQVLALYIYGHLQQ